VLGSNELITPEDLPDALLESIESAAVSIAPYHERVKEAKRLIIIKALKEAGGNHTQAARRLGLYSTNLHRLIRDLKIKRP
jgi:transcriptional regulator with GAF, ATPase, and Fis domain